MSKVSILVKNQILEKVLDGYRPTFRYGERLQMYNNLYKVVGFQDKGFTILEDEKNGKIAFPTNKLRMLMKNGTCGSLGVVNTLSLSQASAPIEKAVNIGGPSNKVGVTSRAANAAYAKPSGSGAGGSAGQPRGEPVGTVRNGSDGDTYKKISANPSVWVRVKTGSVHHEAGGEEQDPMSISHEARQQFHGMMSKIESKVHPQDREKIHQKAQEWVKENAKFKHMQAAHNVNEVDDKGAKMPKKGLPSATMSGVFSQGDKARKVRQELIEMVKESHRKLKGDSGAK